MFTDKNIILKLKTLVWPSQNLMLLSISKKILNQCARKETEKGLTITTKQFTINHYLYHEILAELSLTTLETSKRWQYIIILLLYQ